MHPSVLNSSDRVLIVGATGFVGKRLIPELVKRNIKLRLLVRDLAKASPLIVKGADIEVMQGDLLANSGLAEALRGIHTAYYLVHSMGGKTLFRNEEYAQKDRTAAKNFIAAAEAAGLKRIIYLGGLGETRDDLSEHLRSRAEIAKIISSGKPRPRSCAPPSSSARAARPSRCCATSSSACRS